MALNWAVPPTGIARLIGVTPMDVRLGGTTIMISVTSGAALKKALPAWSAAMVQVPTWTPVTTPPETVQNVGESEVRITGRPELAKAVSVPVVPTTTADAP